MTYNYRYIARIVIQAETPIVVGSGNKELTTDRPVAKDANGLPYIPGTALAGVLRHAIYDVTNNEKIIKELNDIFGYQDEEEQENSLGSRLALSSAHLLGKNGRVFDGLFLIPDNVNDVNYELISQFRELPVRQHIRMSHKGAADTINKGKFDEEVLYKGSRFIFEIEMKGIDGSKVDGNIWKQLLDVFRHPDFRIGGGSNRGFGRIKVIYIKHQIMNLKDDTQRIAYLDHSSCLEQVFEGVSHKPEETQFGKYAIYRLNLIPENFYLFSSCAKSDIADMNPVKEKVIEWDEHDNPTFSDELVLVPASSIKGAISHRVAFNYNKLVGNFADELFEKGMPLSDYVGEKNIAVKALFGSASDYSEHESGQKGNVLFSDVYRRNCQYKKLDHVAIDRSTGGTIDGALFHENLVKETVTKDNEFILEFLVNPEFPDKLSAKEKENILNAFRLTLDDICNRSLPLGGGTMRGNGVFKGTYTILKSE